MTPDVSVLLLTRNGLPTLSSVIEAVAAQRTPRRVEVVAVDSGSTDGTLDLLRRSVDRLVEIPPGDFNHGATRNAGVERCRAPRVVLLVQDAVPDSRDWLERLVAPLDTNPRLAGTYARQIPRADASPITRQYLSQWIAASTTPRVVFVESPDAFERLSPMERYLTCAFDNVCSCVRRDVWERFPFKPTRIAEDVEWALDVLLAGYGLAYVPDAAVVHSHDRSARYELARTYLVHQRLRALFGLATVPTLLSLARAVASTMPAHLAWTMRGERGTTSLPALTRALALGVAFPLGQYLGVRSADSGRELLRVRGVV